MIQHPKKMLIEKIIQKDQNIKLSYNQDTNLKNEFIKHHTTRIHDSAGLTSHIWRLCYVLTFYSIQGSKTERLKNNNWNQRLRVIKTRISDLIWTVASLTIAMHY